MKAKGVKRKSSDKVLEEIKEATKQSGNYSVEKQEDNSEIYEISQITNPKDPVYPWNRKFRRQVMKATRNKFMRRDMSGKLRRAHIASMRSGAQMGQMEQIGHEGRNQQVQEDGKQ